ncbi:von Willebrand factor A domain-containing protein 8-like isoform X3 [Paralichthys olivaceus]|uniref:von Willebrand factor A domain-containing protein 8-like isoform X3 n=1 Tax=Paralichthys olivaceus TaxID=8255 RepID=UPI0037514BE9
MRSPPKTHDALLQKPVAAIGELRSTVDQGTITYPWSTREVVNIVQRLQKSPGAGVRPTWCETSSTCDSYNKDTREALIEALHKHGIPIGAKPTSVKRICRSPQPEVKMTGCWSMNRDGNARLELSH